MRILRKTPNGKWEALDIENSLHAMQEAVGGYIEYHLIASDCALLCDEEGRYKDTMYQDFLGVRWAGNVVLVGVNGKKTNFCDVPEMLEDMLCVEEKR